jgi:hypothetical protein
LVAQLGNNDILAGRRVERQSLPIAGGVALSPLPIVAVVLMLVTSRGRANEGSAGEFAAIAASLIGLTPNSPRDVSQDCRQCLRRCGHGAGYLSRRLDFGSGADGPLPLRGRHRGCVSEA